MAVLLGYFTAHFLTGFLQLFLLLPELSCKFFLPVYSCAENLVHPKIRPSSCIDPELVKKLCPDLAAVLPAAKTQKALQLPLLPSAKDISREKLCGCIPAKDIGTYDSCRHGCVYCYACNSKNSVLAKLRRMNVDSENL